MTSPVIQIPVTGALWQRSIHCFAATGLLLSVASCGAATELASSGGGSSNLNFSSPYAEINIASPANMPAPGAGAGSNGVATGDEFVVAAGAENVTTQSTRGRFQPNWGPSTRSSDARLAWATYWLDMTDRAQANQIVLSWLDAPRAQDIWIGLANWDANRWVWRKLTVAETLTPPSLDPYIRSGDMMLACTILVMGTQAGTLADVQTDGSSTLPPPPPGSGGLLNVNSHLGINLGSVSDYAQATPFVDVFKTAREWISQDVVGGAWDNGIPISVDSNGWVTSLATGQAAAAVMLNDAVGVYPSGNYVCLYDGDGTIQFLGDASIVSSDVGRIVVNITPTGGLVRLRITATNPADYVRNIRLIMPGFESTYATEPFHPDFLASIQDFKVLRFMDWGRTNESEVSDWADRTTPSSFTQARVSGVHAGVALETMVDLANANLSDAWICIPHLATDDFVIQAATLVRDRLDPRLRVHFEYSNEVWNGLFPASQYAQTQGIAAGLSTDPTRAKLWWYSQRANEVLTLCSSVFAEQPERLVRVIAGQSSNPWVGVQVMDWNADLTALDQSTVADRFDVYAVAPYFGGYLGREPQSDTTVSMSVTEVLAACDADSQVINGLGGHTESNALNAADRGIPLISYEGGQHLVGVYAAREVQALTNLFVATNRDAGMRQVYADDLNRWKTSGGGLYMSFTHVTKFNKYGSWGVLESQNQDIATAPKMLGLMDYLATFTAQ